MMPIQLVAHCTGHETSPFEAQLVAQVIESLSMHMMENARFMAERLYAEFPHENNAYLLGTCNYWCDKAFSAYAILSGCTSPQSRYMFALCCMKLGKYTEAEKALQADTKQVPNGAYGHFLLGRIAKLTTRGEKAAAHFEKCLILNPMMWNAYEELCALGAFEAADRILGAPDACTRPAVPGGAAPGAPQHAAGARDAAAEDPVLATAMSPLVELRLPGTVGGSVTPAFVTSPGGMIDLGTTTLQATAPNLGAAGQAPAGDRQNSETGARMSTDNSSMMDDPGSASQHSTPLLGKARPATAASAATIPEDEVMNEAPTAAAAAQEPREDGGATTASALQGQADVVRLLQALGKGHSLLAQYRSQEAIAAFDLLPAQHYQTAWVLSQVGKAHFELVSYAKALEFFRWSREQDPYRVEGLEWHSTVLWHMKREVDISHLAQDALSIDRLCPQAWCVMGNCFSMQKEHELAIKFFQRALQIDPNFTYAYTLCGHEYFANEDFEKSLMLHRNAIAHDKRHYNAWYGIGQIYYRQEKYDMAINNFRHALAINPRSAVLKCYLGMAYLKQGDDEAALRALQDAIATDRLNPLARYEYASALIQQERYTDAIAELEKLKHIAPREATVYFQMGRLYKKLGNADAALTHLNHALDLKPTSTDQNLIKSAIERLHMDDDEVEDEI